MNLVKMATPSLSGILGVDDGGSNICVTRRVPLALPALLLVIAIAEAPALRPWAPYLIVMASVAVLAGVVCERYLSPHHHRVSGFLLAAAVIASVLSVGSLQDIPKPPPFPTSQAAVTASEAPLARRADEILPPALARFTRAVIFGDMTGLLIQDRIAYRRAGLTHLLAISGVNVAIMAILIRLVLMPLPMLSAQRDYAAAAVVGVYVLGIGAPPSALRAAIMAILVLIAHAWRRTSDTLNVLAGAAFLTLLVDPASLYDAGFQLSYAASFGLILWTRSIMQIFPARPRLFWPLVAGSTAAQALTLPLMAWHFQELAPIAFLANLVVIPIFALLFPLTVFALFGIPLASAAASLLLARFTSLIEAFATLPGASFSIPRPPLAFVVALLALGAAPLGARQKTRLAWSAICIAMALVAAINSSPAHGIYRVTDEFGRYGVVATDDGHAWILDGGVSGRTWKDALGGLGVVRVERVIVTKPSGLEPWGPRAMAPTMSIVAWDVPTAWMKNPDRNWVVRHLAAEGARISWRDTEPGTLTAFGEQIILAETAPATGGLAISNERVVRSVGLRPAAVFDKASGGIPRDSGALIPL